MLTTKPSAKFRRKRKLNEDLSFIFGIKNHVKSQKAKTESSASNSTPQRYFSSATEEAESPYFSSSTQPYLCSIDNNHINSFNRQQQYIENSQTQQEARSGNDENVDWKLTTISSLPQLVTAAQSRAVLAGRKVSPNTRRIGWKMCSSDPVFRIPTYHTDNVPSTPSNSSMGQAIHYFDKTPMRSILDTIHGPSTYNADDISSNWGQYNTSNFVMQSPWMSRIAIEDSAPPTIAPPAIFDNNTNTFQSNDIESSNFSLKELVDILCGDVELDSVSSFMDQSLQEDDVEL